ncbi:MAG TPA: response regulator transcription factor [Vicinamibacteria bacterium]
MPPIRVAIFSDDRLLAESVRQIIAGEPSLAVVGERRRAASGPPPRAAGPEVLLVDSRMEGALALCAEVRREGGPAVIFMAGPDDDAWAMRALLAGARGILARSARAEDVVKAVRVVSEGQVWARRHVLARMQDPAASFVPAEPISDQRLSDREREVYRSAAMGLSNQQLASRLGISQATVKAHLTNIFRKLGLRGRAELAAAYHGMFPLGPPASAPGPTSRLRDSPTIKGVRAGRIGRAK